ncbi:DUF3750 domain-containing protein [Aureimonas leprariae]|uniref:DUF3750 domain-containing protein n=1 Tax=Plantimonas leprariae TaxID=2615207 RepID=A0A7V7TWP6_9HYPH|nr:DUF3750 domain-containing protein [Aureimonas leprariae]KAB0680040.1 DUF3750 domain-containing protein [Aureimonas leprariae]
MRILKFVLLAFVLVYLVPAGLAVAFWYAGNHPSSWRDADWTSAKLLPPASAARDAAVYVFAARTGGLKGAVSEHSWIVVKDEGAPSYERWDKVGWGSPIRRNAYPPDGRWYSNPPRLVLERHGEATKAIIPAVRRAIETYPFAMQGGYHIFPGPNSNTFVEHVLRNVPGLRTTLPPAAIGRDFPSDGRFAEWDGDRGDLRLSILGYAGVAAGATSGFEVNILGLVAGIDPRRLAVKVPAFGTYALLAA